MQKRNRAFFLCLLLMGLVLAAPVAAQDEPIDVVAWFAFTDYRLDWLQEKAAAFNEQFPQYNVTIEGFANYEELFTSTTLAAEQNSLPAIIQYFEVATQDALDSGYFKPVAEAIGDREEINGVEVALDDIVQPASAYYTIGGQWSSMPFNTSSAIWFSDMNVLRAAGIEEPPATWGEVDAACEAIMALDNAPQYCWTFPNHGWFFEQWLGQQNALFANNDNGRSARATEVVFNSEAGLAVLEWLDDQAEKGYLYYSGTQGGGSWSTAQQPFLTGQVAMVAFSSSDTAPFTETGAENGLDVVASFLPYNEETGWTGNLIGGASLWLVDGLAPEVEDGALTFLLWLINTENAAEWHQVTGYIPIRESAVEMLTEAGWFEENPNFIVASEQLAQSEVTPATSGAVLGAFPAIRDIVTQAIDTVLLTDEDPATVLEQAAREANQTLEEYNLLNAPEE
ncbi:MAG: extracellular solute-binding protein [Chloroflexota bacterium]|nr:MAG: ABC transporter substrate-binding protein [Chloroflexota bacterium]